MITLGLCSDPSQSDPETKDFWLNMATLTETLQRQAEQNPAASYYNVVLLRYQVGQVDGVGQCKGARTLLVQTAAFCKLEGAFSQGLSPGACWNEALYCPLLDMPCNTTSHQQRAPLGYQSGAPWVSQAVQNQVI